MDSQKHRVLVLVYSDQRLIVRLTAEELNNNNNNRETMTDSENLGMRKMRMQRSQVPAQEYIRKIGYLPNSPDIANDFW